MTESKSIWTPLVDMISYQGNGNYQTFDRFFVRVLNFRGLQLQPSHLSRMKRRVFRLMRVLGILELDSSSIERRWSVPGNQLFTCQARTLYLGNSHDLPTVTKLLAGNWNKVVVPIYCEDQSLRDYFAVEIPSRHGAASISDFSEKPPQEFPFSEKVDQAILSRLPSTLELLEAVSDRLENESLAITSETEFFSFEQLAWFQCSDAQRLTDGYFRTKLDLGKDLYFIRSGLHSGQSNLHRLVTSEWGQFVAASLLNKRLALKYRSDRSILMVPKGLRLPTLLERILFLSSLERSEFQNGYFLYPNITKTLLKRLLSAYPILRLEEE